MPDSVTLHEEVSTGVERGLESVSDGEGKEVEPVEEQGQQTDKGLEGGKTPEQQENERFDKHPRFKELYSELKALKEELAGYKNKQSQSTENPRLSRLVKMGFDPEKAKELLEILKEETDGVISPLKEQATKRDVEYAFKEFYVKHPDITPEIGAEMNRLFNELKPETQKVYANDFSSLDMLYAKAEKNLGSDYRKGQQDMQQNIRDKKQAGSFKGAPTGKTEELTAEIINKMSPAEFEKRKAEIYEIYHRLEAEGK